jgi:hypothetical protein
MSNEKTTGHDSSNELSDEEKAAIEKVRNQAIVDSRDFFSDLDNHFAMIEKDRLYQSTIKKLEPGQKVYLEIEVKEPELTPWLFKWLYGQNDEKDRLIPFGAVLHGIHLNTPPNEAAKAKIINMLNML